MVSRRSRPKAGQGTRERILSGALACFAAAGYERTTMRDIRARTGASTGSIYHHFRSKEQLAAALYVEGIRDALDSAARALTRHRDAERGVRALVGTYMRWIEQNPEIAAFCLRSRGSAFLVHARDALGLVNRELEARVLAWMAPHFESGALPVLEPTLYWAVLMGPSDHVARVWASEPGSVSLRRFRRPLEEAAWRALQSLRR